MSAIDREDAGLRDEAFSAELVSTERVYEGRVWDLRRDTVDYNGTQIVREYVDHTGAVAVLALDDDERVLLIRQYRHPVRARLWEIPAGLLDAAGESPLEAAKRELAEEADLRADDWSVLGEYYTTPGGSDEAIRVYLARGLSETPERFAREAEEADIEKRWVSLDDAVAAVRSRDVQNPSLVVGVLSAAVSRATGWTDLADADAEWTRLRPRTP